MQITFEDVRKNQAINAYIQKADESLIALGYTEHSFPHVLKVANTASQILTELGYSLREAELLRRENGEPYLCLSGSAAELARKRGFCFCVSITHTKTCAAAAWWPVRYRWRRPW